MVLYNLNISKSVRLLLKAESHQLVPLKARLRLWRVVEGGGWFKGVACPVEERRGARVV